MPRKRELTVPWDCCRYNGIFEDRLGKNDDTWDKRCTWDKDHDPPHNSLNPGEICDRKHCPIRNGTFLEALKKEMDQLDNDDLIAADIAWQEENAGGTE